MLLGGRANPANGATTLPCSKPDLCRRTTKPSPTCFLLRLASPHRRTWSERAFELQIERAFDSWRLRRSDSAMDSLKGVVRAAAPPLASLSYVLQSAAPFLLWHLCPVLLCHWGRHRPRPSCSVGGHLFLFCLAPSSCTPLGFPFQRRKIMSKKEVREHDR